MFKPEVTGRIDLGHIIQAVMVFVVITGGVIGSYLTLHSRLGNLSEELAGQQQQISDLARRIQVVQDEQKLSSHDAASGLTRIAEQLTDLRVLVAGISNGRK